MIILSMQTEAVGCPISFEMEQIEIFAKKVIPEVKEKVMKS